MGDMKSLLDVARLPRDTEEKVEELIAGSIADEYFGSLTPYDPHPLAQLTMSAPIDPDRIHQLLTEMWGHLLTEEAINAACDRFVDAYSERAEHDDHLLGC